MLSKSLVVSAGLSLGLASTVAANRTDKPAPHRDKTAPVPAVAGRTPIATRTGLAPAVVSPSGVPIGFAGANPGRPAVTSAVPQTIRWETSFAAAQFRARREGKPILLLHLFGKLNDVLC